MPAVNPGLFRRLPCRLSAVSRLEAIKRLRGWHYRALLTQAGEDLRAAPSVRMGNPGHVSVGDHCYLGDGGVNLTQNTCWDQYSSLPNKLFEYLPAGIPVLGCVLPEIAQVLREYQVGEIVEPIRPESLADRAHRVFSDPEYYQLLAQNSRRAAARFNLRVESQNLLNLYRHFGR